ncbi:MAG TPA: RHS repeat-associated core domain-containing protein, partial [Nevskiales bacterium]|nr:RHS repeat-associated core domain-containing protein [Nevskiales bacterium]
NDFGYTGHFTHHSSGLALAPYRAYDPDLARWLSRDPIGEAGGINLYAYVMGNPVSAVDSLGLQTCLLTTVGPAGIRDHSAVYTTGGDAGEPALYDPAGSYGAANGGGSSGLVTGDAANIAKFKAFHEGQKVESTCKDTSQEEEESIIKKAVDLPAAAPFQCAVMSSSALSGQPSFPHVKAGTFWPGNLLRQFRKGQ